MLAFFTIVTQQTQRLKEIAFFLPTTTIDELCEAVWKDGASADTSHVYIPDPFKSTDFSTRAVSDDFCICEKS